MTSSDCPRCRGIGWVCENHPDKPWDTSLEGGCECAAGAPCPRCSDILPIGVPDVSQVMIVDEVAMQRAKRLRER